MNGKDEMLVEAYTERMREERNDKMFSSMAQHIGEALKGVGNGNDPTIERTLLAIQLDIRVIREELCKLNSRVDKIEQKQLFEVIERKPTTNETNYSTLRTESSGGVLVEL